MTGQQQPPPRSELRLFLALFCLCALQAVSGFPQPLLQQMDGPDIPKIERLALCFSQWTALSNRPQISNFVMNRCSSIFNSMQVNEQNNQEIYKRFLFHYSRAQEPTYPHKTGSSPVHPLMRLAPKLSDRRTKRFLDPESHIATAEFTKKDSSGTVGRPFFLFRARNGREAEEDQQ
ncbi:neuromedin-S [Lissotriton helveticus]